MWTEETSVHKLEKRYMTKERRRNTVTLFEDVDIDWNFDEDEISQYIRMWKAGIDYQQMVEYFDRNPGELGLLHFYLGMKGRIKPRKGGLRA